MRSTTWTNDLGLGLLNPLLTGAATAFSSVFVVINSLRLRRFAPTGATSRPGRRSGARQAPAIAH